MKHALFLSLFLVALPTSTRADPPREDPRVVLERNVQRGIFPVTGDAGMNVLVLGPAYAELGRGAPRHLVPASRARADLILVGVPLASDAPRYLSSLRAQPVRAASREAFCDLRVGSVFVASLGSRSAGNTHREAPMTEREEISETWASGGEYVVALLEGACAGPVLATTRTSGTPARAGRIELPAPERAAITFAYEGTAEALEASSALTAEPDGARLDGVAVHAFGFADGRLLTFVVAHIPQMGCDPDDLTYPVIFARRDGRTRLVSTPHPHPSQVLDIDGDGAIELMFEYGESHTDVYSLSPDGRALELMGQLYIGTSIGC